MTQTDQRLLYLKEGLQYIPKLLQLLDKNRLSNTYGCFDRAFWHYRTSDFPSGMYQEAVLPLALAYKINHPENSYFEEPRLKELVSAGIDYARRSSHPDGCCDDYFPYERAAGATAFALYACTEAALFLDIKSEQFNEFFELRGRYLANQGAQESGTLSNHKALFVLALHNVFLVTGNTFFKDQAAQQLKKLLILQTEEGWFPEYEGCDPGYLTFTIDFLAKYYAKTQEPTLLEPLKRAIQFASHFMHPDGSYGGEYGSRNTFHFMPHGMELFGQEVPIATALSDKFLNSLKDQTRSYLEDDRIFIHYVYDYLQSHIDFCETRSSERLPYEQKTLKFFPIAGLLVQSFENSFAVFSTHKGGVGKIFRDGKLVYSDCGLVGKTSTGQKFISQLEADFKISQENETLSIEGYTYEHSDLVFTPTKFLIFRVFVNCVGRFFPANTVRKLLQKKAILKKKKQLPLRFKKTICLKTLKQIDWTLTLEDSALQIQELWVGTDPTFIYIATSQPYQKGALLPWIDLSNTLQQLNEKRQASYQHFLK
jgi:hypothetical protein